MINPFQDSYLHRLTSWSNLRRYVATLPLDQACVEIDKWWQQAPLVTRHLHPQDTENWTDPWEMLSENTYCLLTRAIGMCYNLLMVGIKDVRLVIASDNQAEEHYLVLVDNSKYTLNYWPGSVISTSPEEFTIIRDLSLDSILNKIK
jgi:hypothetical protein